MKRKQAYLGKLRPQTLKISILPVALLCLSISFSVYAQRPGANSVTRGQSSSGLEIGDEIPKEVWDLPLKVVNHPEGRESITLNEYKGKLIILDFWATWCGSCIASMPKLHKLEADFNKDVVVLPVTYQPAAVVTDFIRRNDRLKSLNLFSVVNYDSLLQNVFPHRIIPHIVWIGPEGNLVATTAPDYVTAANISRVLAGNSLEYAVKKDIDTTKPLFVSNDLPEDAVLDQYSIFIKGRVDGLPGGSDIREREGWIYGYAVYNKPISVIFRMIIRRILGDQFSEKRIIYEVDTAEFFALPKDRTDLFSFEVNVPLAHADSLYHIMLARLNRSSKYHCKIEEKYQKCLVLQSTGSLKDLSYTGGSRSNTLFRNGNILRGHPLSKLVQRLNFKDASGHLIVLDETGYTGKVDMEINAPFNDHRALTEELNRHGLDLVTAWRSIPMFVFTY